MTDIQALVPVSKLGGENVEFWFLFDILSQVIFSIVFCSLFYYSWRIYLLKKKRLYPGSCSQTMVLGWQSYLKGLRGNHHMLLTATESNYRRSGAVGCTVKKLREASMVELKIWYYFLLYVGV